MDSSAYGIYSVTVCVGIDSKDTHITRVQLSKRPYAINRGIENKTSEYAKSKIAGEDYYVP